jgi:hypothetical protein
VDAPHLRIVTDDAWQAAHARLAAARAVYLRGTDGRVFGRRSGERRSESPYLLTGLAQCGICGNSLIVRSRASGKGRAFAYACSGYHQRGPAVCRNARVLPLAECDGIVLETLLDDVLTPDVFTDAVHEALGLVRGAKPDGRLEAVTKELAKVERERDRLVAAIAAGGNLDGLLGALSEREKRIAALKSEWDAIASQRPASAAEARRLQAELLTLANRWRDALAADVANARPIVSKLLTGRLTFTPLESRGEWSMSGKGTLIGLFSGSRVPSTVASPTGTDAPQAWEMPIDRWMPATTDSGRIALGG